MTQLASSIVKAGALLDDTRALLHVWDSTLDDHANVERIIDQNLLGLPTQKRAEIVMSRALYPRFIAPDHGITDALLELVGHGDAFRDACYYELTRVDDLVACFAEEALPEWWDEGRLTVTVDDVRSWIDKQIANERAPEWSVSIRERVSQGLLATLRDFGRLRGAVRSPRKEITRPDISIPGFAYVAYRLHQQGASSRAVLTSTVWRRWLLDSAQVDELMHRLASLGVVYYAVAGSSLRIDWRADSLAGVVRAAL